MIPKEAKKIEILVFKDGNAFCAVFPNFINLQESECGFGKTEEDAIKDLMSGQLWG